MIIRQVPQLPKLQKKKFAAAYARVSTGKDAMLHSLSEQVSYYSDYIQKQPGWLYCGVYVDEAVTGTKEERPAFQRLIQDCRDGKINMIYKLFLQGKTPYAISCLLNTRSIPTPTGKTNWNSTTVASILTNEKYKGDALLQKEFTVDYLSKKKKRNEGEVPQYYIENSHPAIIDPAEWDMVQAEFTRRKGFGRSYSGTNVFSAKLICSDCGDFFGLKVWHSTDKHRKEIWQCNHKFQGEHKCTTPHLVAEQIQQMFLQAYNELITEYILEHPGEQFDVAPFVDRRCKTPIDVIQDAVDGAVSPEQAVKLRECLHHIDELEIHRSRIEKEIEQLVEPFSACLSLIRTVPGMDKNPMTAITILSEIGSDMSVFPTAKKLVSWAGCCPRNDKSAKHVKSTRISRAGSYLKPLLVQVANALINSKEHPEILERYRRIKARRGHKKAIIAVCKMLLTAIWNILSTGEIYNASGYILQTPRPTDQQKVLTSKQALELLRVRGYIIKDDPPQPASA